MIEYSDNRKKGKDGEIWREEERLCKFKFLYRNKTKVVGRMISRWGPEKNNQYLFLAEQIYFELHSMIKIREERGNRLV